MIKDGREFRLMHARFGCQNLYINYGWRYNISIKNKFYIDRIKKRIQNKYMIEFYLRQIIKAITLESKLH